MADYNEIRAVRTTAGDVARGSSQPRTRVGSRRIPVGLLLVVACLVIYGLIVVYAAVQNDPDYSFTRQAFGVAIGTVLMILVMRFDYRKLAGYTTLLLIINIVLILSPHLPGIGVESNGARSWIRLGTTFQPGEFAKITVILLDASLMARYGGHLDDPREYCKVLVYMAIPFLCILTQPDLGTGLVYLCIDAVALIIGGARLRYLVITLVALIAAVAAVFLVDEVLKNVTGSYQLLKDYQRSRLSVFADQESSDSSSEAYNLQQAMIAIGSGGLFGKGFLNGTQTALGYVPESATDFIFCVLAEQFGFVGCMLLLGLYLVFILIDISIARNAGDMFGTVLVMGAVGMWLFQILENIGMDIGLMPITGIPLPFISYGTSFMLVNFILVGLVGSVAIHRSKN
jgi:rod shape determining protein RodA